MTKPDDEFIAELERRFDRMKEQLADVDREKSEYRGPCGKCAHFKRHPYIDEYDLCTCPLLLNYKFNKETGNIEGSELFAATARAGLCGENGLLFAPIPFYRRVKFDVFAIFLLLFFLIGSALIIFLTSQALGGGNQ